MGSKPGGSRCPEASGIGRFHRSALAPCAAWLLAIALGGGMGLKSLGTLLSAPQSTPNMLEQVRNVQNIC